MSTATASPSPARSPDVWLSRRQALTVVGLPPKSFDTLVAEGRIAILRVAGSHPKYSLQACRALMVETAE